MFEHQLKISSSQDSVSPVSLGGEKQNEARTWNINVSISNTVSKKWKARAQAQESGDKEEPQVTTTSVHYQKHPTEML